MTRDERKRFSKIMADLRRLRWTWGHIEKLSPASRNYLRARLMDPNEEIRMVNASHVS